MFNLQNLRLCFEVLHFLVVFFVLLVQFANGFSYFVERCFKFFELSLLLVELIIEHLDSLPLGLYISVALGIDLHSVYSVA